MEGDNAMKDAKFIIVASFLFALTQLGGNEVGIREALFNVFCIFFIGTGTLAIDYILKKLYDRYSKMYMMIAAIITGLIFGLVGTIDRFALGNIILILAIIGLIMTIVTNIKTRKWFDGFLDTEILFLNVFLVSIFSNVIIENLFKFIYIDYFELILFIMIYRIVLLGIRSRRNELKME